MSTWPDDYEYTDAEKLAFANLRVAELEQLCSERLRCAADNEAQLRADLEAAQERISELEAAPKRVAGEWVVFDTGQALRSCPCCEQSVAFVRAGHSGSLAAAQSAADAALVVEGWQLR